MEKVGFSGAFTFIYSPREGTPASKYDGQIPEEVSKNPKSYTGQYLKKCLK